MLRTATTMYTYNVRVHVHVHNVHVHAHAYTLYGQQSLTWLWEVMVTGVRLVTYTSPWFLGSMRMSCFSSLEGELRRSRRVSL